jgi:hypothetical protein
MPMQPGGEIQAIAKGSLGCFVYTDGSLYFTIARRPAARGAAQPQGNVAVPPAFFGGEISNATTINFDTCLVGFRDGQRPAFGPGSFQLLRTDRGLTKLWDPTGILNEKKQAKTPAEMQQIAARKMAVCHVGAGLVGSGAFELKFDGSVNIGAVTADDPRLAMTGRTAYPTDCGAPVFNESYELVGFVSSGADSGPGSKLIIVLAYHVFKALRCERATWENRAQWSGVPESLSGRDCLVRLGHRVAERKQKSVEFIEQTDRAFTWNGVAVHPLQALETAYQRAVHRDVAAANGEEARREAEVIALSRYFVFAGSDPSYFEPAADPASQDPDLASVKMNSLIGTFYLFRLLINYQIGSGEAINEELRASVSGELTSLLHNNRQYMGWLSVWLQQKLAELGGKLNALGGRNLIFFLKGGRALKSFLDRPYEGENDWDTQIVLNPDLPATEWYALFARAHDLVLQQLRVFKLEFNQLVEAHRGDFARYIRSLGEAAVRPAAEEDDDEDAFFDPFEFAEGPHRASCKAELIDVGIPRRDSPAGIEEWRHLNDKLLGDAVKYPGYEYYLNEYLFMVRDARLFSDQFTRPDFWLFRVGSCRSHSLHDVLRYSSSSVGGLTM